MSDAVILDELIYSGKVPDHILREFALDCAERAMLIVWERCNIEPIKEWFDVIEASRLYNQSKVEWIKKRGTIEKYMTATWPLEYRTLMSKVDIATDCATRNWPQSAAHGAAYWCAELFNGEDKEKEIQWQTQYLVSMVEDYKVKRALLLKVMADKRDSLLKSFADLKTGMENALFT